MKNQAHASLSQGKLWQHRSLETFEPIFFWYMAKLKNFLSQKWLTTTRGFGYTSSTPDSIALLIFWFQWVVRADELTSHKNRSIFSKMSLRVKMNFSKMKKNPACSSSGCFQVVFLAACSFSLDAQNDEQNVA